jgi:hypothetical protein
VLDYPVNDVRHVWLRPNLIFLFPVVHIFRKMANASILTGKNVVVTGKLTPLLPCRPTLISF